MAEFDIVDLTTGHDFGKWTMEELTAAVREWEHRKQEARQAELREQRKRERRQRHDSDVAYAQELGLTLERWQQIKGAAWSQLAEWQQRGLD